MSEKLLNQDVDLSNKVVEQTFILINMNVNSLIDDSEQVASLQL